MLTRWLASPFGILFKITVFREEREWLSYVCGGGREGIAGSKYRFLLHL